MEKYITKTKYHCGIDLHKSMSYICVMNKEGEKLVHMKIKNNDFEFMKKILKTYWDDLTIACETTYNWYILADFCHKEGIDFALGHALYMKNIHGEKAKNDRVDSEKITDLLRTNNLPKAYACPAKYRSHRDLLRRRIRLVQSRSGISGYISLFEQQNNLKQSTADQRRFLKEATDLINFQHFNNVAMERNYTMNARLLKSFNDELEQVDKDLKRYTIDSSLKEDFEIVKSIPGAGDLLSMVIVYETHDIKRFKGPAQYASYCRVIKCLKESNGKRYGSIGVKIGNPNLKWALGEIAVLGKRSPIMRLFAEELERRYGQRKGRAVLMHKLCRAIYFMLHNKQAFNPIYFYGKQKYERLRRKVH